MNFLTLILVGIFFYLFYRVLIKPSSLFFNRKSRRRNFFRYQDKSHEADPFQKGLDMSNVEDVDYKELED